MKKSIVSAFLLMSFIGSCYSQSVTKNVLFLGNSYTGSNNLPKLIADLAGSTGDVLTYDAYTPGGQRLMGHASNATSLQKIKANAWDFVVIQAQSQEPSWSTQQVEAEVLPYAAELSDSVRAKSLCATPLFFMTWGRENGDAMNCQYAPWVCSYEGMDSALNANYMRMAIENSGAVSPVGAVWRKLRDETSIQLYSGDGSHPSYAGSYAAACTFYASIFKKDPRLANWDGQLDPMVADSIRKAAYEVVFETISYDFTKNYANAAFNHTLSKNNFMGSSATSVFDTLLWNISDGTVYKDTLVNHVFADTGVYTVELVVWKCGKADTLTKDIVVDTLANSTGFDEFVEENITIYPNPVIDRINFSGLKDLAQVHIYSIHGNELLITGTAHSSSGGIDVSQLKAGIYSIKLTDTYGNQIMKLFIKS